MVESKWADPIKTITPYLVLIETPTAQGTGAIVPAPPGSSNYCAVTALHVIEHAHEWHEPIKLVHFPSDKEIFLDSTARNVSFASERDQAIIEFSAEGLVKPEANLPLFPVNQRLLEGVEIGWLGYPAVAPRTLCFFHGHISAWLEADEAYLVDGVAINGVSGGPAFLQDDGGKTVIVGLVTEYRPNMARGNPLPGVSLVRAINPLARYYDLIQKQIETAKVQTIPKASQDPASQTGLRKNAEPK